MVQELDQPVVQAQAKIILIVEDDQDIGDFLVQAILAETSYQPLLVTNGYQAIKASHDIKPNLLIFDYQLPRMNGIELYDEFQANKELQDIPAFIISASLPSKEIAKRQIVGLHKPLELSEFLALIEKLIG